MRNKGFLILLILVIFCIGVSTGSVFASDDANSTDNLAITNNSYSINKLRVIEDVNSMDNLSKIDELNLNNKLSLSENESSEVLFLNVNSHDDVLSSTVPVLNGDNSHTFKVGKYKITITDNQYNKIKKATHGSYYGVTKKTGKYHTYKVPKYKTKTVTTYKWKYINVVVSKRVYSSDFMEENYYDYNSRYFKYVNKGWKYCGYKITKSNNNRVIKVIDKFKKKVKVKVKKKIKVGYTTKKVPIKIEVCADLMNGANIRVYSEWYSNGYNLKNYAYKEFTI